MDPNQDKRKLKRRHLIYYLRVFNRLNNELLGHLVDLTSEGIMIIGERLLPAEMDYQLHMTLPEEIMGKNKVDFDAHAIWSRKDVDPSFFGTGFRMIHIDPDDVALIQKLIEDFGFLD
jgi:hypothetical protein